MARVAIIQARMGSSRLPGKVLKEVLGRPLLALQVERVRLARGVDQVVIATSVAPADEAIAAMCSQQGISCFRGSENDVLDRFYQTACAYGASTLLRLTGDCPLVDPELITKLIENFDTGGYDHYGVATGAGVARGGVSRFPDGLDTEVIALQALETAWRCAEGALYREHVTPFLFKNPDRFKSGCLMCEQDLGHLRWTVDRIEDFEVVRRIFEALYPEKPNFAMRDVLQFLAKHPEITAGNAAFADQNANYAEFWK